MLQLYKWTCYMYISPGNFFVGVSRLVLRTLTLFQTKNLPQRTLEARSANGSHFQTWRWSQNTTYSHVYKDKSCHFFYLDQHANKKIFLKSISNLHIIYSFSFIHFGVHSYSTVVPLKTISDSTPKWAKSIHVFRPKRHKNTYLYGLHNGIPPPPTPGHSTSSELSDDTSSCP